MKKDSSWIGIGLIWIAFAILIGTIDLSDAWMAHAIVDCASDGRTLEYCKEVLE